MKDEEDDHFSSPRRSLSAPLLPTKKPSLLSYASGVARAFSRGLSSNEPGRQDSMGSELTDPVKGAADTDTRIRTMTEQIELQGKAEGERQHLNAVVGTTIGTTLFLFALMTAIALAPVPSREVSCFGCCRDEFPCAVESPPGQLRSLGQSELSVVPASSSGYITFFGEVEHTCYCPVAHSTQDINLDLAKEFVFEHDTDSNFRSLSELTNLLDGSPDTYWCSLPQGLLSLIASKVPKLQQLLTLTFPQYVTVSANIQNTASDASVDASYAAQGEKAPLEVTAFEQAGSAGGGSTFFKGVGVRTSSSNECAAKVVQVQAAASPATFGKAGDVPDWLNVTSPVTLCCAGGSPWQWIPFNETEPGVNTTSSSSSSSLAAVPTSDYGRHAVLRLVLVSTFGNPHRVTLSGVAVYVDSGATLPTVEPSLAPSASPSLPPTKVPSHTPSAPSTLPTPGPAHSFVHRPSSPPSVSFPPSAAALESEGEGGTPDDQEN